jgi:hypothetical protein
MLGRVRRPDERVPQRASKPASSRLRVLVDLALRDLR